MMFSPSMALATFPLKCLFIIQYDPLNYKADLAKRIKKRERRRVPSFRSKDQMTVTVTLE